MPFPSSVGIKGNRAQSLIICRLIPGTVRTGRLANPEFIQRAIVVCNSGLHYCGFPYILRSVRQVIGTKAEKSLMMYYFSSPLYNWWHAWDTNPRLPITGPKPKHLWGDSKFPRLDADIPGRRSNHCCIKTLEGEPLGTEFRSKSNTLVDLLEEQVHRDYDPWTDRKTWTRTGLRSHKSMVQPNAHQHTGCELRRRRNHTPALLLDTGRLALRAATKRKASTPTAKPSRPVPKEEKAAVIYPATHRGTAILLQSAS